jgi:DUF4097 and DUF4098 domain-containing protein YvlB
MHTFETPGATAVTIQVGAGQVTVVAEDTDRTTVELTALNAAGEESIALARIEQKGRTVVVHLPRLRVGLFRQGAGVDVAVTCPRGTSLVVRADSADVRATGTFGDAVVTTGSGNIDVDTVTRSAKLKAGSGTVAAAHVGEALIVTTGSGDVNVDHTGGHALLTVGSGHITIGELAGETVTKTGSGDVDVARLDGTLLTKSGSGSLTVRRAAAGQVTARGASGNVDIGIEDGTAAWLDVSTVSGRISQELGESEAPGEGQQRVEITAHTVSGNLRVHRS